MDKIAMYEMLLEDHPLWDKVASEKKYTGGQVAGAAIGTGVGGAALGYGAAEEVSRGKVRRANRAASSARSARYAAEMDRDLAKSARDIARRQARRAASDAQFHRGSSRFWRDTAMNMARRRGR